MVCTVFSCCPVLCVYEWLCCVFVYGVVVVVCLCMSGCVVCLFIGWWLLCLCRGVVVVCLCRVVVAVCLCMSGCCCVSV